MQLLHGSDSLLGSAHVSSAEWLTWMWSARPSMSYFPGHIVDHSDTPCAAVIVASSHKQAIPDASLAGPGVQAHQDGVWLDLANWTEKSCWNLPCHTWREMPVRVEAEQACF